MNSLFRKSLFSAIMISSCFSGQLFSMKIFGSCFRSKTQKRKATTNEIQKRNKKAKTTTEGAAQYSYFLSLPDEILVNIFGKMSNEEFLQIMKVNKRFYAIAQEEVINRRARVLAQSYLQRISDAISSESNLSDEELKKLIFSLRKEVGRLPRLLAVKIAFHFSMLAKEWLADLFEKFDKKSLEIIKKLCLVLNAETCELFELGGRIDLANDYGYYPKQFDDMKYYNSCEQGNLQCAKENLSELPTKTSELIKKIININNVNLLFKTFPFNIMRFFSLLEIDLNVRKILDYLVWLYKIRINFFKVYLKNGKNESALSRAIESTNEKLQTFLGFDLSLFRLIELVEIAESGN